MGEEIVPEEAPRRRNLTSEEESIRDAAEKNLWKWNLAMAILHGVQAIIVLAMGIRVQRLANFKLPLSTSAADYSKGYPVPNMQIRGYLPFVPVTSGFAWMSSIAHILVLVAFSVYKRDLRKGINRFRWYEYAFSSSLMIALIAMLFGMYDILSLILLMSVNACMNLFGYMMELHNQTTSKVDWTSFWFGCFAGVVPWAVLFTYLGLASQSGSPPAFVWAIIFVYLIAFNTFPINMAAQYARVSRWADSTFPGSGYYFGEKMYQIQSLVSKSLLLWLVVGGANQPNEFTANAPPS
ncbi:hypothetical protein HK102_004458 [Quaeritorhiza haematococci]|nr:hypothetical protein HK102_004458 [Quaeritorhiza haematococci]